MKLAKVAAAAAALSLAVSPAVAQSAPERASAPAAQENQLGQAGIFVLFALLAVVIGFIATDDDNAVSA